MRKIASQKDVIGIYDLKEGKFYGECEVGKKTKMSHKMFQHLTRVLESLHMSIIGLMQDDSYGGQRYIFYYDDNYSRLEKCDTLFVCEALFHRIQREKVK